MYFRLSANESIEPIIEWGWNGKQSSNPKLIEACERDARATGSKRDGRLMWNTPGVIALYAIQFGSKRSEIDTTGNGTWFAEINCREFWREEKATAHRRTEGLQEGNQVRGQHDRRERGRRHSALRRAATEGKRRKKRRKRSDRRLRWGREAGWRKPRLEKKASLIGRGKQRESSAFNAREQSNCIQVIQFN
jgi:hypothetical protein